VIGRVIKTWTFFLIMSLCFLFFLHCCSPSEVAVLAGILWLVFHSALYRPSAGPQVAVVLP
jgi:hypothetical protein